MTLKLHKHKIVEIDEDVEIEEGQYITYLIHRLLELNPDVASNMTHDHVAYAFATHIGGLYQKSIREGTFIEPQPLTAVGQKYS